LESEEIESVPAIERGYEPFRVKSFGENIAVNLGMIFVTITALILSMLLLPHLLVGVTWNGG
jgi:hypothetical protein